MDSIKSWGVIDCRCPDRQFGEAVSQSALPDGRRATRTGAQFEIDGAAGQNLVPEPAHEVEEDISIKFESSLNHFDICWQKSSTEGEGSAFFGVGRRFACHLADSFETASSTGGVARERERHLPVVLRTNFDFFKYFLTLPHLSEFDNQFGLLWNVFFVLFDSVVVAAIELISERLKSNIRSFLGFDSTWNWHNTQNKDWLD